MNITFYNSQQALDVSYVFVQELAHSVFKTLEQVLPSELIIHLVDKETITKLHADFFNDPTPTDCISFPLDDLDAHDDTGYILLGEIFVCPEVAIEYACLNDKKPIEETALYIIHGILHLLGYDDIEEKDRLKMRSLEDLCMNKYFSIAEKQVL
ncbi:MAG: rRNA maturation RNase YbeY [Chlamydiota bacterium]